MKAERWFETRVFFNTVVLIGNAVAWAIPGNVAKLVAREDHVVLGRYSRAHFCWLVFALLLSFVAVLLKNAPTPRILRRRVFATITVTLGLVPAYFLVDVALRLRTVYPYDPGTVVYTRPPNAHYELVYEDAPEAKRSFPNTPPGFGRVDCTMTFDDQGYRNARTLDRCDAVVLGDSFTEGSRVSDDQTWPVRFAAVSGLTVCNLGMSGYSPPEYLASLEQYGLPKKPRLVICMLYEGNDFRTKRMSPRHGISFSQVVATSPIIVGANNFLVNTLGAIGADRRLASLSIMNWLPITLPAGPNARPYTFAAKQLTELYEPREKLELKSGWYGTSEILKKMHKRCQSAGATFVVAYAPNKAHVILPLTADSLPAEDVLAFARYKKRKGLPDDPHEFMKTLLAYLPNQESIVRQWCERRGVPFVSLTDAMRDAVLRGRQTYYTYDQHWTPLGHETAARAVFTNLKSRPRLAGLFNAPPSAPPDAVAGSNAPQD